MKVITFFVDMTVRFPSDSWKDEILASADAGRKNSVETNIQVLSQQIEDGAKFVPVANDPRIMFVDRGDQYYYAEVQPQYVH